MSKANVKKGDWVLAEGHWVQAEQDYTEFDCIDVNAVHHCVWTTPRALLKDKKYVDRGESWQIIFNAGAPALVMDDAMPQVTYGRTWCYFDDLDVAPHPTWGATAIKEAREWAATLVEPPAEEEERQRPEVDMWVIANPTSERLEWCKINRVAGDYVYLKCENGRTFRAGLGEWNHPHELAPTTAEPDGPEWRYSSREIEPGFNVEELGELEGRRAFNASLLPDLRPWASWGIKMQRWNKWKGIDVADAKDDTEELLGETVEPLMVEDTDMSMKRKLIGNPVRDLGEAGYLVAAKQLVQTAKAPIVAALVDEWGRMDDMSKRKRKKLRKNAHKFFNSELGDLLLGYALAAAIQAMPIPGLEGHREKIAYFLRIHSAGEVGNRIANVLMDPLRGALESAVAASSLVDTKQIEPGKANGASVIFDAEISTPVEKS